MKDQLTQTKEGSQMEPAMGGPETASGTMMSMNPPPFQLRAGIAQQSMSADRSAPIQRYVDATEIVGNVSSGANGRGGGLDATSNRHIIERIAQLEGLDPVAEGEAYEALDETARAERLRSAILRFQQSSQGSALIHQITEDNAVTVPSGNLYERPSSGSLSDYTAPRPTYEEGAVANNDITMQALANAWPRNFLGHMLSEVQAYALIQDLLSMRGLPFVESAANVVSIRGFQGGEIHDNDAGERGRGPMTRNNRYNDTTFVLSNRNGEKHVTESRSTVDPGDLSPLEANATETEREDWQSSYNNVFRMEADQQWTFEGDSHGRSSKYDRPMYSPDNDAGVTRGRYWTEHQAESDRALRRAGHGSRIIRNRRGTLQGDVNRAGKANRVSAVHSGGSGGVTGDRVQGDSTGCSVVHGAWFGHFNESVRRAAGGTDATRFNYTLLDLTLIEPAELQAAADRASSV